MSRTGLYQIDAETTQQLDELSEMEDRNRKDELRFLIKRRKEELNKK